MEEKRIRMIIISGLQTLFGYESDHPFQICSFVKVHALSVGISCYFFLSRIRRLAKQHKSFVECVGALSEGVSLLVHACLYVQPFLL